MECRFKFSNPLKEFTIGIDYTAFDFLMATSLDNILDPDCIVRAYTFQISLGIFHIRAVIKKDFKQNTKKGKPTLTTIKGGKKS